MAAGPRLQPSTCEEERLWSSGRRFVAGVDEVGRGPLAGPVYAAAVMLDPRARPAWLEDLRDSKVLLPPERERLAELIRREALAWGLGWATAAEIDGWGITLANRMAMFRALAALRPSPQFVLIDGPSGIKTPHPQRAIVDGDATCASIAAASIVAKVARDSLMCELDGLYPQYGFASHKGYATRDHLERLARYGASPQHRRSWPRVQLAVQGRLDEAAPGGEEARDAP
ncbi:MAG TPA: ribonuclease HII [Dehalococcoidia bacterium]|nr:ribonuclease HII [Dehalococcoidia bacterium]